MARQNEQTADMDTESTNKGSSGRASQPRSDENDQRSHELERRYQVRQVTNIQASWTEMERGEEGKFTLQLILDNGVKEYILEVDSDDIEPMLKLFAVSEGVTFDVERKVLMFPNLTLKQKTI
ncbi:MAG: hypothetical protein SGJ17_15720 [Hyphomicrobiales bacterium]|nr:hypothetical protein [Hyphomicrobiales bacterium]